MKNGERAPRTRQQLLSLLKANGDQDAALLAEQLGISAMAVRQHLYDLQESGLVTNKETPRPIGRPAKLWRLTPAADQFFPDGHAELAVGLIDAIRRTLGEDAMDRLLEARGKEQISVYSAIVGRQDSLSRRLASLAKVRSQEGYMASVKPADRGRYLFVENHCPVCAAATSCTGICATELHVFQEVLGSDTRIERTDHILAGARRCAYLVEKIA